MAIIGIYGFSTIFDETTILTGFKADNYIVISKKGIRIAMADKD